MGALLRSQSAIQDRFDVLQMKWIFGHLAASSSGVFFELSRMFVGAGLWRRDKQDRCERLLTVEQKVIIK
jgi:hypothetical protein